MLVSWAQWQSGMGLATKGQTPPVAEMGVGWSFCC